MKKVGIIDLGTNTFHLLIADKNRPNEVVYKEKVAVRLGQGGISDGRISEDAMHRAINTLKGFVETMKIHEVDEIIATATSAVRSAGNKDEFLEQVEQSTGIKIEVLCGEDEAFLIHQGVKQYIDFEDDTALIVDIGGGSIEFIIADNKEVKWLKSYEIGGQRLIDQFHKSDPITVDEKRKLEVFLNLTLEQVFENCQHFGAKYLIGSSGSFDTFWDIFVTETESELPSKPTLNKSSFLSIYQDLLVKNREERLQIPGMISMRVDMIIGASIVMKTIMDACDFDLIKISPFALKEGVLYHGLPINTV